MKQPAGQQPPPGGDTAPPLRVALFSRYSLPDQYDLAAEFEEMLRQLGRRAEVLHLSLKGPQAGGPAPEGVTVDELPLGVDRSSKRSVLLKTALFHLLLPLAAVRLRRFKPDVIFQTECFLFPALFLKLACGTRVATAYGDWHFHNFFGRKWWGKPMLGLIRVLEKRSVRCLDGYFLRAESAALRLQQQGVPAVSTKVVRDAPDADAFRPRDASELRARCGFTGDDVVFLFHGVMHQGKGLDLLMRWIDELHAANPRVGLVMVGGGPEEGALREMAGTLAARERIVFTGWLETLREVGDHCNAADVCVAMRTRDDANAHIVPGALLHSMACGRIVMAPRLPGIAEIIRHGDNGFLFEADDAASFIDVAREIIDRREAWTAVARSALADIRDHHGVAQVARAYADAIVAFAGAGGEDQTI